MDLSNIVVLDIARTEGARSEHQRDEESRSRALFILMMLDFKKNGHEPMKVEWDLHYRSRKCEVFQTLLRQAGVEIYENTEGYLRDRGTVYRVRFARQE